MEMELRKEEFQIINNSKCRRNELHGKLLTSKHHSNNFHTHGPPMNVNVVGELEWETATLQSFKVPQPKY